MRSSTACRITASAALCLAPWLANAYIINCENVVVQKKQFNLGALDNQYSLYTIDQHPPTVDNTTFAINFCRGLKKREDIDTKEDCPVGSRGESAEHHHDLSKCLTAVCAITNETNTVDHTSLIRETIPIAGEYSHTQGGSLDPKWTRFKTSSATADKGREGLRLEMHGGMYKETHGSKTRKKKQKAIIEFICERTLDEKRRKRDELLRANDKDNNEDQDDGDDDEAGDDSGERIDDGHGGTLKFISFEDEEVFTTLRLEWKTKYACEDSKDSSESSKSGHWGWFTWFIIM